MTIESVAVSGGVTFANDAPFVLIGGMNVIESEEIILRVAERFVEVTSALDIPYVFKASFDKPNRRFTPSSTRSPSSRPGPR